VHALNVHEERGVLHFVSRGYYFDLGSGRARADQDPLPTCYRRHYARRDIDEADGWFRFTMTVTHPFFAKFLSDRRFKRRESGHDLLFTLIVVQALLGDSTTSGITRSRSAFRTNERRPRTHAACREGVSVRLSFLCFAWYEWHGAWAALIAIVFAVEVVITLADFIVEDQTRIYLSSSVSCTPSSHERGCGSHYSAPISYSMVVRTNCNSAVAHGISWVFTVFSAGVLACPFATL